MTDLSAAMRQMSGIVLIVLPVVVLYLIIMLAVSDGFLTPVR